MESGTPEHKAQVCQDFIKTYQENMWKEEIQIMEFEDLLGSVRKQKAALDLELEGKSKPAANSEKKALAKLEADIESTQAAIKAKEADKEFWNKRIELVKRYLGQN